MASSILVRDAKCDEFLKPMLKSEGLSCFLDLDLTTFSRLYQQLKRMELVLMETPETREAAKFIGLSRIYLLRMFEIAERENLWFEE